MPTNEILIVSLLALLPALGNFAGGLAAEYLPLSKKNLNRSLHAAAGVILAIVAIEVMPKALVLIPAWLIALMFLCGGCFYLLIDTAIKRWQNQNKTAVKTGAWMIYLAVAADLIGDGLLIGSGSAVSLQLGLILSIGQVIADIPSGYAVIANFRHQGISRKTRLWLSASFILMVLGAAIFSYFTLSDQSAITKIAVLVFVAGLYTIAAVEDMMKEAHDMEEDSQLSSLCFIGGFSFFILISGGFH